MTNTIHASTNDERKKTDNETRSMIKEKENELDTIDRSKYSKLDWFEITLQKH